MSSPAENENGLPNDPNTRDRRRRSFYGLGERTRTEKNVYGRFLDDVVYGAVDVSIPALPALWWVVLATPAEFFGVKSATLFAWLAMVVGLAAIRSGLVSPPGRDVDGWVSLSPSLVAARVLYYNVSLLAAGYVGGFVGSALGVPIASIAIAVVVAGVAIVAFPRVVSDVRG